jgi:putative transposase
MKYHKTYKFKLEPTAEQERQFASFAGARRFVYNWALARCKEYYQEHGKSIGWKQLSAELTQLKNQPGLEWLCEVSAQILQQSLADLKRAVVNFFEKRARYPKFKTKKDSKQSFRLPQGVQVCGGFVKLPKIGAVRVRQSQPVEGVTKSATIKRTATGHWHMTIVAEFELLEQTTPEITEADSEGFDLGLTSFLTTSEGTPIDNPRFFRQAERKLRKAQRRWSRRRKGSRNYAKAKLQVAKVHAKIARKRSNFCHQLSSTLIKSYDGLFFETLSPKGLARTKLSKSMLDAAQGEFCRQIKYKAVWSNRVAVFIDRFYPSSQLCSVCGYKNESLSLKDRRWTCPVCLTTHDRDVNAAINIKREGLRILAAGLTESQNACGVSVRPGTFGRLTMKQESPAIPL